MGEKFKFLNSGSLMNETTFDTDAKLTGSSFRFGFDALKSPYGNVNIKQMVNTDGDFKFSNHQTRVTLSSPDLKLVKTDKIAFNGALENWTTFKFDKNFDKQDIANSIRPKLKLKVQDAPLIGDFQAYSAVKFDCTQSKPDLTFKGGLIGVQKNFGKFSTWAEGHVPPEGLQSPAKTSFVIGLGYKLW